MHFLILRLLTHSELGMFHEYRRQKKEGSKQRAVNFDGDVVDRVFPAAKDSDRILMDLRYDTDAGSAIKRHWLKRQEKNWRLEGNCPKDKCYTFVESGSLFALEVDAGVNPAVGSWAVFPKESSVTKAVLSDGDSNSLAKSAMISLHRNEGRQIWRILGEARPDLFSPSKGTKLRDKKSESGDMRLEPEPKRLVKILAAVGHTLPSAVADLVDNAISANATKINIAFGRPDAGHGRWIAISDNGKGMDSTQLAEAMRIGSKAEYERNSLGKYGYGLKGASWSQTDIFTVVSSTDGKARRHLTWDANQMDGWVAKSGPLEAWEEEATELKGSGTVVLWKNMRPPQSMPAARGLDPHSAEVMELGRHLALVFHRFVEGTASGRTKLTICINDKPIEPNNPVGHPLASPYDAKAIRIPTGSSHGHAQVRAYLLPSEDEIQEYHKADGPEAVRTALDLIGLHGKRNETQGLFIYRHDRLIKWGGWHQMWTTTDEKTKLARVVVDFKNDLDDVLKINISKQIVHLPQQLQAELKKLAEVARKDSQKKYRKPKSPKPGNRAPLLNPIPNQQGQPVPGAKPNSVGGVPVTIKPVKTEKFVWKISIGMTGNRDVQVSDLNPSLSALVDEIRGNSSAIAHLADFLDMLDQAGVQGSLLAKKVQ